MSTNYSSPLFKSTIVSPLEYSKKFANQKSGGSLFSEIMISAKEVEKNQKNLERDRAQKTRRGKDIDNFFVDYAKIRDTGASDNLAEISKNLDTGAENHILSQANRATDEDLNRDGEKGNTKDVEVNSEITVTDAVKKPLKTGLNKDGIPAILLRYSDEIDCIRKMNENSTGDAVLTADQIAELKSKYNLNDLSPQEQYDLFCDLTDMNVLSMEDIGLIGVRVYIPRERVVIHQVSEGDSTDWLGKLSHKTSKDFDNLYEYMLYIISCEQDEYDYMLGVGDEIARYGNELPTADPLEQSNYEQRIRAYEEFEQRRDKIDNVMNSHKKVASVLAQLM